MLYEGVKSYGVHLGSSKTPARVVDPRPNRPPALHAADVFVDRNGLVYFTDFSAGLYIAEYWG